MPIAPVSRDVTARGIRTRVVEIGSGTPLILLHGFLSSHRAFDDVIEPLAARFHVIAVDLPGFGDSEKPPPSRFAYGLETFAEIVADVIAALQVGRSHLLGHAMGGAVALTLAAEHPEFVDHLVLVAPQIYSDHVSIQARLLMLPIAGAFVFKQVFGRSMFGSYFRKQMYAPGNQVPIERIDSYFEAFNSPPARESAYAVMRSLRDTRASIARLTKVKSPTLVVWGRSDPMFSPLDAPRLVRQMSHAHMEFIDSGHCPHEEQPERFFEHVQRFLLDQRQ